MSQPVARQLWFTGEREVCIREQPLSPLQADEVRVKSLFSAISAGTELLLYRGQMPQSMALDETIDSLADNDGISYPLQYGYAVVGEVEETGAKVDPQWLGKRVFSFQPHASHFNASLGALIAAPEDVEPTGAVFLANMETAVNLLHDGNPRLGERIAVIGQGIVGLLVSAVAKQCSPEALYAIDGISSRRERALELGVDEGFDPFDEPSVTRLTQLVRSAPADGADVVFELSGTPQALNLAIELCGYSGRIVVGSWYGTKTAAINLGERYHRNRMTLVSSQVSSIAPELSGRWDKARRFALAWEMIRAVKPQRLISHTLPFEQAASAYQRLDEASDDPLQIVFDYQA